MAKHSISVKSVKLNLGGGGTDVKVVLNTAIKELPYFHKPIHRILPNRVLLRPNCKIGLTSAASSLAWPILQTASRSPSRLPSPMKDRPRHILQQTNHRQSLVKTNNIPSKFDPTPAMVKTCESWIPPSPVITVFLFNFSKITVTVIFEKLNKNTWPLFNVVTQS